VHECCSIEATFVKLFRPISILDEGSEKSALRLAPVYDDIRTPTATRGYYAGSGVSTAAISHKRFG